MKEAEAIQISEEGEIKIMGIQQEKLY